jgi:hypothetical protein
MQIATAFIHLLSPAITELSSSCLSAAWLDYVSQESLEAVSLLTYMSYITALRARIGLAQHVFDFYR